MDKIKNERVARSVRFDLADNKSEEFRTLFKDQVLPMMKKQSGFKDEILLVHGKHVLAISLWNSQDAANRYESSTYPEIAKALGPVISNVPTVETFEYNTLSTLS